MFVQRLRGLVNLHSGVSTAVALMLLLAYAGVLRFLPRIELNVEINLMPYLLCVLVGMVMSDGIRFFEPPGELVEAMALGYEANTNCTPLSYHLAALSFTWLDR